MASFSEVARRKFLGVPLLYWAAGFTIILAIVAWKLKPAPTPPDTTGESGAGGEPDANQQAEDALAGFATRGTVTVVQAPQQDTTPDPEVKTNEGWIRDGATWLTTKHQVPGSTAASSLRKFVEGQDRSYQEQEYVDMWIAQGGQPPETVSSGGKVSTLPPTAQGTPPITHTVKGNTDNNLAALAGLYYGSSSDDRVDQLQAANIGTVGVGPYPPGAKVSIPKYRTPHYYNIPFDMTAKTAASRNSITVDQLSVLNDPKGGRYNDNYGLKKGTQVRVA